MASKIPKGMQPTAEMKKQSHKLDSKDIVTTSLKAEGILKPQMETNQRNVGKVHKGVSSRYGQQAELRDQNQLLMAAKDELQKNLTQVQQRVAELETQCSDLEKENAHAQMHLKDCHVLLVAEKMDLVSGKTIAEAARESEKQRREVTNLSKELLHELTAFGDIASKQRTQLGEIQATMKGLVKEQEHLMQERERFSLDVLEMEKALKEAERLLME